MSSFVISITGGTGSGKTFIANQICEKLGEKSLLFSQDNYYLPKEFLPKDENNEPNFDLPESLDLIKFEVDLEKLINGNPISFLEYNYNNMNIERKMITLVPKPVIVVEGIFAFYTQRASALANLKLYIETEEETRMERRIQRDLVERGYDKNDVDYKMKYHIAPAFAKFVAPMKYEADIIIPNNKQNSEIKAINVISSFLENIILK